MQEKMILMCGSQRETISTSEILDASAGFKKKHRIHSWQQIPEREQLHPEQHPEAGAVLHQRDVQEPPGEPEIRQGEAAHHLRGAGHLPEALPHILQLLRRKKQAPGQEEIRNAEISLL